MARKRRSDEGGVNLDSLMDALTNVVAVLILVLILVQADVTQKVEDFLDNLDPATPEEVQQSKQELAKIEEQLKKKEQLLEQDAPTPRAIEEEKRQLALLEKDVKEDQSLLADLEELKQLEAELRKEQDSEQKQTRVIQDEIARLEALLDATPVLEAPPPAVVSIPNSRPIPNNAETYYALAFNDRVHLIDPFSPVELFMDEFKYNKIKWQHQRIKRKGKDRYIYDQRKIAEHFKDFDFKNPRGQQVTLKTNPISNRIGIEVRPDPKAGGTSVDDLAKPGNPFAKSVAGLARNRRAVLFFWVNPNSFNTYLLARGLTDDVKLPAGWEVRGNQTYWIPIPDIEVQRLKEPPPPDPNKKPKPPGPPKIEPKLD